MEQVSDRDSEVAAETVKQWREKVREGGDRMGEQKKHERGDGRSM